MPNLFEYQDYRSYLKDYYSEQKARRLNFSYRSFSEKAGIKAQSFLYYVIDGKRNLTKITVTKIGNAIGLKGNELDYFENLVFFNQAQTITEKSIYYGKLVDIRKPVDIKTIGKDRFGYYSTWYHCIIREMVTFIDFNENFELLGKLLIPPITEISAKESIQLLLNLGFIQRDIKGVYYHPDKLIFAKVGPETDNLIIEKFQTEMLKLAQKSYYLTPVRDRISSSITFSISKETFEFFKMRIRDLQSQLMESAGLDDNPEQVYQLTLNLFPACKPKGEKNEVL